MPWSGNKWPAVAALAIVVAGLVASMALGAIPSDQGLKVWGYLLATVVYLLKGSLPPRRSSERPSKPPGAGGPLAILASGDAVGWLALELPW